MLTSTTSRSRVSRNWAALTTQEIKQRMHRYYTLSREYRARERTHK